MNKVSRLKIGSLNIGKNIDTILAMKIKFYMNKYKLDILCLQETSHEDTDQSRLVNIFTPMVTYWSNDCNKSGVGQGVGIVTRQNIIGNLNIVEPGYLIDLEVHGRKSVNIINVYFTKSDRNVNMKKIQGNIKDYWQKITNIAIICGDFNTDINDKNSESIVSIIKRNKFELLSSKVRKNRYTYESGGKKSFIDHFFISSLKKKLCIKCKIYNEFKNIVCKHKLISASFKYKSLVGWKSPILRSSPSRFKIDFNLFKLRQKQIKKRVNRIKGQDNLKDHVYLKYFLKKIKKVHIKSCGIKVGNRGVNRQALKILKNMDSTHNEKRLKKLDVKLKKTIARQKKQRLQRLMTEFEDRGAYKVFSSRITLKRNTKFLQYGRIRTSTGYENTFDTKKIKIDTEDYYKEYLG